MGLQGAAIADVGTAAPGCPAERTSAVCSRRRDGFPHAEQDQRPL